MNLGYTETAKWQQRGHTHSTQLRDTPSNSMSLHLDIKQMFSFWWASGLSGIHLRLCSGFGSARF